MQQQQSSSSRRRSNLPKLAIEHPDAVNAHTSTTQHQQQHQHQPRQQRVLSTSTVGEGLAHAFAREHRSTSRQWLRQVSLTHEEEGAGSPTTDGGESRDPSREASRTNRTRSVVSPPVEDLMVHPSRGGTNAMLLRSIASLDDFPRGSGSAAFSPIMPLGDDFPAAGEATSPRRQAGANAAGGGHQNQHYHASAPTILSPRQLHLKPEFTHPALFVTSIEVKIKDIQPKFLQRHGRTSIQWNRVRKVSCTPFHDANGLSEATLFHCVLDLSPEPPVDAVGGGGIGVGSHGGLGATAGSAYLQYGATGSGLGGPTNSTPVHALPVWRRVLMRARSVMRRPSSVSSSGGDGGGPLAGGCINAEEDFPVLLGRDGSVRSSQPVGNSHTNLNNVDLFNYDFNVGSSMRSSGLSLPPPAPFLVVKHYDTSVVESPSVLIRIARHLTATTAEKMVSHEIFFYSKLSGFFCEANSPFRCPKPMFITKMDRGDPGFLRYVCCGTGSGTIATIGLEDMQRSGFSFDHTKGDGLFDETVIYSVLVALAFLHSAMWDRCHEPSLQGLESAAILLFVHRGSPKVQPLRSKNEFAKLSVKPVMDRWASYPPTAYVNHRSTRTMVTYLRMRWDVIRSEALDIIQRRDTVLHGDVHYKNIGFRTKYGGGSHTRRKVSGQHAGGGPSGGGGTSSPSGGGIMLHRYFSTDNAVLREGASSPVASRGGGGGASPHSYATLNVDGGAPAFRVSSTSREASISVNDIADVSTPIAKQSAESIDIQPCFLDYQSCGPGSVAAELLYFICTSVPVEVDLNHHGSIVDIATLEHQFGTAALASAAAAAAAAVAAAPAPPPMTPSVGGGPHSSVLNSNSFAGLSPPPTENSDDRISANIFAATQRVRSGSSGGHTSSVGANKMTLEELLSFDIMLISTYFRNLDPQVQVAYPLPQLIHDVYVLARHWAGCIFFDLATTPPQERAALKRLPQYERLIAWGERTAERVYAMCVAVFTEVDGRAFAREEVAERSPTPPPTQDAPQQADATAEEAV